MQIQSINNNDTNFKAITGVKAKGKYFRENPEKFQKILEKIVSNEKYNFPGESVSVVAKTTDYADFCTRMLWGIQSTDRFQYITSDIPLIKIKTVEVLFYENLKGNMFTRAWKHIKGVFTNSKETTPYKLLSWNFSLEDACEGMLHLLDQKETKPSKDW